MKKIFSALLAVLFVNVIAVQAARAATYEAPFVAVGGSQVPGSEGKVNEDGSYKVEILTAMPNTIFEVCRIDVNSNTVHLADVTMSMVS